jgi:hypothetical protein
LIPIDQLDVTIRTVRAANAETGGFVYLGTCGREFRCDTARTNFRSGALEKFSFGELPNVLNPAMNDPRSPAIDGDDIERFPAYIRFDQRGSDHWLFGGVDVNFNGATLFVRRVPPGELWMGLGTGAFCHLVRPRFPVVPL